MNVIMYAVITITPHTKTQKTKIILNNIVFTIDVL